MGQENSNVVRLNFDSRATSKNSEALSRKDAIPCEEKQSRFAQWLQKGTVCLLLDARKPSVRVPQIFKHQGDLRLNFCYQFHVPDFGFNQRTTWATLSFPDGEFFCQVPWTAVYAMHSAPLNKGSVWFKDFPSDLDQRAVLGFSDEIEASSPQPVEKCNIVSIESARKKI